MAKNWMCDKDKCKNPNGEVRLLPTGGDGNAILCFDCFLHELQYRREENARLGRQAYELPEWSSLKVYKSH